MSTERKPRVYVAHDTANFNFFPAKRFGVVEVCVEGHVDIENYDIAIADIRESISDARSGDYLLPIGSPVLIAAAAVEMVKRTGSLNILTWDRISRSYNAINVGSLS